MEYHKPQNCLNHWHVLNPGNSAWVVIKNFEDKNMTYSLTITRKEPNPDYDPRSRYRDTSPCIENVLLVDLTEEQYELLKKTIIEQWK